MAIVSRAVPPAVSDSIPKSIIQTWKSKAGLPETFRQWRNTIRKANPAFAYRLWDDADNLAFIERRFPFFLETYRSYPAEIFRVDAVRYFWMFEFGGFYIDLDFEALKPIAEANLSADVLLGRMGSDPSFEHSLPNAIMASKPRQSFWLFVIRNVMRAGTRGRPEYLTGPAMLKKSVDQWNAASPQERSDCTDEMIARAGDGNAAVATERITILPSKVWYPLDWSDQFHGALRQRVLSGNPLTADEKRFLFPEAEFVTYWSHTWE